MAAVDLEHRPALAATALGRLAETEALAEDERARDFRRKGRSIDRFTERPDGVGTQARTHPFEVFCVLDAEDIHDRRDLVSIAFFLGFLLEPLAELRGVQIERALPVSRHQGVQIDEAANP